MRAISGGRAGWRGTLPIRRWIVADREPLPRTRAYVVCLPRQIRRKRGATRVQTAQDRGASAGPTLHLPLIGCILRSGEAFLAPRRWRGPRAPLTTSRVVGGGDSGNLCVLDGFVYACAPNPDWHPLPATRKPDMGAGAVKSMCRRVGAVQLFGCIHEWILLRSHTTRPWIGMAQN